MFLCPIVKTVIFWGDPQCSPVSEIIPSWSSSKMNDVCVFRAERVNNVCVWKVSALHHSAVNRSQLSLHVTQSEGFSSEADDEFWVFMWGKSSVCPTSDSGCSSADWSVLSRWCRCLWAASFLCCDCLDVLMMTAGSSSVTKHSDLFSCASC